MALSFVNYTGDGTTATFAVPFPYLSKSHISVSVNGVQQLFTWPTNATVTLNSTPANGAAVTIQRNTPATLSTVFNDGSGLVAGDLNAADTQLLYLIQEVEDANAEVLQFPTSDPASVNHTAPSVATRKNKLLGFGADGSVQVYDSYSGGVTGSDNVNFLSPGTGAVNQTLTQVVKALPITPKMFGAVGDGITDDTAALAACFTYAGTVGNSTLNAVVDGGNATYCTTKPVTLPNNLTVRNMRLKALPSAFWVGIQSTAKTTTNGVFTIPAAAGNITLDNCVADGQGYSPDTGSGQVVITSNVNCFCVQATAIGRLRFINCQGLNPSNGQAAFYTLGKQEVNNCLFECIDTGNTITYTGYGLYMDFYNTGSGTTIGSGDSHFSGCRFYGGLLPVYIAPGVFHTFFTNDCHWWTLGGGANGFLAADIWGQGIHISDAYVDGAVRYNTGGTYYDSTGTLQTQTDADIQINNCLMTGHGLNPFTIRAMVANSTLINFKFEPGGSGPTISDIEFTNSANWSLSSGTLAQLNTNHTDMSVTSGPMTTICTSGSQYSDVKVTNHATTCQISFVGGGWATPYGTSAAIGSFKDDVLMLSADLTGSVRACSANSAQAPFAGVTLQSAGAGTVGGHLIQLVNYDPNNTTSKFIQAQGSATTRFIVYSNGNVVNTGNSYGAICDERTKFDIVDAPAVGDKLAQLRVVEFTSEFDPEGAPRRTDFLAQQVETVFPENVNEDGDDERHLLSVTHTRFIPLLVKAFQEERTKRLDLEDRLASLEARFAT